jgi:CrcB protein
MENLTKIFAVAGGGALGAVARHLINISPLANLFEKFPFPTFFINVAGSFFIGFLSILLFDKFAVNENLRIAIIVGLLGAFTTFSTFELEIFSLVRDRHFVTAFAYLFLSVFVGFVAVCSFEWFLASKKVLIKKVLM